MDLLFEAVAALYLVAMALVITAANDWPSRFIFKIAPMLIGLPLAFFVVARLKGWPV